MSWVFLSHFYNEDTPGFGGAKRFFKKAVKEICRGDSSNSFEFSSFNHHGTHIDLPLHFLENGKNLNSYSPEDFIFDQVSVLSLADTKPSQLLGPEILLPTINDATDFLIIKTNWGRHRSEKLYWEENPGLKPELAEVLRARLPQLRAVGFDFISLTAFQHRDIGREAHRQFLGGPSPLLLVEDMNLSPLTREVDQMIVSPFLIDGADGTPVTVLARVRP